MSGIGLVVIIVVVVVLVLAVLLHKKRENDKEKNESTEMSFDAYTCEETCMSWPWSHVSYLLSSFLMIYYLVTIQGKKRRETKRENFLSGVRSFDLLIIERHFFSSSSLLQLSYTQQYNTIVVTSFLCAGVCVCVCMCMCAYIHTHKCKGKRVKKKKSAPRARIHTSAYS